MEKIRLKSVVAQLSILCLCGISQAQEPVVFADPNLQQLVEMRLKVKEPTIEDMNRLGSLTDQNIIIMDLKGLEHAQGLCDLILRGDSEGNNGIEDLSALSGLVELQRLDLRFQRIRDLQPLRTLTDLKELDLRYNQITDLSPLVNLRQLRKLNIKGNPVPYQRYKEQVRRIRRNNPRLTYVSDVFRPTRLVMPAILMIIFIAAAVYFIKRYFRQSYLVSMILMGIASGIVGGYWSHQAQILYAGYSERYLLNSNGIENPQGLGLVIGIMLGVLVGLLYIEMLGRLIEKGKRGAGLFGQAIVRGIATGLICSTLAHVVLMAAYCNLTFEPMLTGLLYGGPAGLILGIISGVVVVWVCHRRLQTLH